MCTRFEHHSLVGFLAQSILQTCLRLIPRTTNCEVGMGLLQSCMTSGSPLPPQQLISEAISFPVRVNTIDIVLEFLRMIHLIPAYP